MAYWRTDVGSNSTIHEFNCTTRDDIAKMPKQNTFGESQTNDSVSPNPTGAGSCVLCLEDSSVWILDKETDEWTEL